MSNLRRIARLNKLYGSIQHATVEETHLGYTTVRLVESGARLTNLYTVGHIQPGEEVIVEYGTDGVPYVRPITTPDPDVDSLAYIEEEQKEDKPKDNSMVVGKIKGGSQWFGSTAEVQMGSKVFDPQGIADGSGFLIQESGMYFIHAAVTYNNIPVTSPQNIYHLLIEYYTSGGWRIAAMHQTRSRGTWAPVPMQVTALQILYVGETVRAVGYMDFPPESFRTLVSDAYPVMEIWRVTKVTGPARILTRTSGA